MTTRRYCLRRPARNDHAAPPRAAACWTRPCRRPASPAASGYPASAGLCVPRATRKWHGLRQAVLPALRPDAAAARRSTRMAVPAVRTSDSGTWPAWPAVGLTRQPSGRYCRPEVSRARAKRGLPGRLAGRGIAERRLGWSGSTPSSRSRCTGCAGCNGLATTPGCSPRRLAQRIHVPVIRLVRRAKHAPSQIGDRRARPPGLRT